MKEDTTYWSHGCREGLQYAGFEPPEVEAIKKLFPMFHPEGFAQFLHLPEVVPGYNYWKALTDIGVRFDERLDLHRPDVYWPRGNIVQELTTILVQSGKPTPRNAEALWERMEAQTGFVLEYPPGSKTYCIDPVRIEFNRNDAMKMGELRGERRTGEPFPDDLDGRVGHR
jgi:hypothetical protein